MAGYLDCYQRTIAAYTHGVKLVLGPTGLGKSSSIPEVVHNNPDRKFIYMANRKELLEEMAARFNPGEYVILRRDLEVVQQVLLTQRSAFETLLADHRFVASLKRAQQISHLRSLDVVTIHRACQLVSEMTATIQSLPSCITERADTEARVVLQAIRWVLQVTRDPGERRSSHRPSLSNCRWESCLHQYHRLLAKGWYRSVCRGHKIL